ncbi:hypothetical protein [Streptomyces sp. NPDC002467]|uniref:hypothetical protein n=1 Tax=Streptomyces sp. NPDC002467 TaxID=3364647 RepID=UPI0036CF8EC7
MAQSAISHRAASQPARAVEMLQQHLAHGEFAARDRAFFTAHLSGTIVAAGEPDQAAITGLTALRLTAAPGYGHALGELRRTAAQVKPARDAPWSANSVKPSPPSPSKSS